jgi:hypothetical protein
MQQRRQVFLALVSVAALTACGGSSQSDKTVRYPGGKTVVYNSQYSGLDVHASDGLIVGKTVAALVMHGEIEGIYLRVGGIFGFFGRNVFMPKGKFLFSGKRTCVIAVTSDDLESLRSQTLD